MLELLHSYTKLWLAPRIYFIIIAKFYGHFFEDFVKKTTIITVIFQRTNIQYRPKIWVHLEITGKAIKATKGQFHKRPK